MTRRRAPTFTAAQTLAMMRAQAITAEAQARGDALMRGVRVERDNRVYITSPAEIEHTAPLDPNKWGEFLTEAAAASPEIAKAARVERKRRTSPSEHVEQVAVIRWCQSQEWRWPELAEIFAVPNGGLRDEIAGKRLKDEGMRRGVEDLFLDVPRGQYHGLRIEMKRIDATPSDTSKEQRERIATHTQRGYRAVVCNGAKAAIAELTWYLGLPEFGILEGSTCK